MFSPHMHAKPLFAHRLQTPKMAYSRTSAQNNGPRVAYRIMCVLDERYRSRGGIAWFGGKFET